MTTTGQSATHSYHPGAAHAPEALTGMHFAATAELIVWQQAAAGGALTQLSEGIHYTISGSGVLATASITALGSWPVGDWFHVERVTPGTQPAHFNPAIPIPPAAAEGALDRLTRILQEIRTKLLRAVCLPFGETGLTLPGAAQRALSLLGFNADGGVALYSVASFKGVQGDPGVDGTDGAPGTNGAPGGNVMAAGIWATFAGTTVPAETSVIRTTGYASDGFGAGFYVDDGADAAFAAEFPRFCKADATGRYFRLLPDAGGTIGAEQAGATGAPGHNDQPAIKAAVDYAVAVGIATVRLLPTHESWQPTFPGGTPDWLDGYHLVVSGDVAILGANAGTTITLKNPTGAARARTDGVDAWHCGWLSYRGSGVTRSVLRNIKVDGTLVFANVLANGEANVCDKGILLNDILVPNLVLVDHRDLELTRFAGELWYMGGTCANTMIHLERVKLHSSPQSALNTGTLAKMIAIAVECGDSYQPAEVLAKDHLYIGCRFYNGYNLSFMFTESFSPSYFYSYPFFTDTVPKWLTFEGTRFENITDLRFGARSRGRIVTVDCGTLIQGDGKLCDVSLDIEAWIDRANNSSALAIAAPLNLTSQVPNCPVGTYFQPPRDVSINLTLKRTETAVANNWRFARAVLVNSGLYTSDSFTVTVRGEVNAQGASLAIISGSVAGATLPRILYSASEQAGWSDYLAFAGAGTITVDVQLTGIAIVGVGGVQPFILSNTHNVTFAKGQRLRIANATGAPQANSRQISMAASGAGYLLKENRKLYYGGDYVDLEWDGTQGAWVEAAYVTRQQLKLIGSATYDAPSIAAGASTTTTVAVSGAALGDKVTAITLAVSATGLTVTGYVSAADAVTVVLANLTGGAIDLASTTLAVEVAKA